MSKVVVHRNAAKYLQRLPSDLKERIKNILIELGQNPSGYIGVKHMVGEWAGYRRIRSGKFRIICFLTPAPFSFQHITEDVLQRKGIARSSVRGFRLSANLGNCGKRAPCKTGGKYSATCGLSVCRHIQSPDARY